MSLVVYTVEHCVDYYGADVVAVTTDEAEAVALRDGPLPVYVNVVRVARWIPGPGGFVRDDAWKEEK